MDENSNVLENSDMINFAKFRMIYNTINTLLESAKFSYRFEDQDVIFSSLFQSSNIISNADDLYAESLLCEARKGLGTTGKIAALSPRDTSHSRRKKSF